MVQNIYDKVSQDARKMQELDYKAHGKNNRKRPRKTGRILAIVLLAVLLVALIAAALPYFHWHLIILRYQLASFAVALIPFVVIALILLIVL